MTTDRARTWEDLDIQIPSGASGEVYVRCPACDGQRKKKGTKPLAVNVSEQVFVCNHCLWKGSLSEGETRKGDPAYGASLAPKERVYVRPQPPTPMGEDEKMSAWFQTRGISPATWQSYGIRYTMAWMPQVEDRTGAVAYPYYRGKALVNVKYRDGRKNFRMEANAELTFYGLNDVAEWSDEGQLVRATAEQIVIVEGEMDKLAFAEAGIRHVLSVPNGAPPPNATTTKRELTYFSDEARAIFDRAKTVVMAVDNDEPGRALKAEIARKVSQKGKLFEVEWPEGCKDANDTLMKHGPDRIRSVLGQMHPMPIAGIIAGADLTGPVERLYEHGLPRGLSTGWPNLDHYYRVVPGHFTVVTGIPSHGKTQFIDALAMNLASHHDWRFAICSPEYQPPEVHTASLVTLAVGKPFDIPYDAHTLGPWRDAVRMTPEEMRAGMEWVADHVAFVLPDPITIEEILDRAETLVWRDGIQGLIVDPWTEIESRKDRGESDVDYIGRCLSLLTDFARRFQVATWLIAHPTKLRPEMTVLDGDEKKVEPVPTPYDIAGAAHFMNKPDFCIAVWRDRSDVSSPVQIHVQKVRYRHVGKDGLARLKFDLVTGRYRSPESGR